MSTPIADLREFLAKVSKSKKPRAMSFGDSWFQYPLRKYADIERRISSHFGKNLILLDDSYPGRDAKEGVVFLRRWEGIAKDLQDMNKPFNLFLASMGGNDVIGRDFRTHLKKKDQASLGAEWPWNHAIPQVVHEHVLLHTLKSTFESIRELYVGLVALRDKVAPTALIISHTYADVTPMNVPYKFAGIESGPWLWTYMVSVGLKDPQAQRQLTRWLLESFKNLLEEIRQGTHSFEVLDSRLELAEKGEWDNEIHPLGPGFRFLAEKYWIPKIEEELATNGSA